MVVALSAPRVPVNRKYTFVLLIFKILWSKAAAADLAKPPFRGQKSDSFERKCSKSFSKIVLPMRARTTFFKKCHAKSELDRKNHERCILKLAFLMHNRCASWLRWIQNSWKSKMCSPPQREALFWRRHVRFAFPMRFYEKWWKSKMCSPPRREALFCKFHNCIKRARKQEIHIFPTEF